MPEALSIPPFPLAMRMLGGVRAVASGAVNREIPQDEFVSKAAEYQTGALHNILSMPDVVYSLWRCEGLATTFGKYRIPENTLNDPQIPREALPVVHAGYGAASAEYAEFNPHRLIEIAQTKAAPNYQGFFYEGIGSIVRIYEPGIFKLACGVLGLIPMGAAPGPVPDGFFAGFFSNYAPDAQRLIAHGYGRLVAFSNFGVHKALAEAMRLPPERVSPCVQGIAFAFAMMNAEEMPRLLNESAIDYPASVRASFQNGLVYSLIFCDWFAPGLLEVWKTQGGLEEKLVEKARDESARNLKRGYPLPFMLENPLT
jgi:hypothetical protein